jgi:hypothetical protein
MARDRRFANSQRPDRLLFHLFLQKIFRRPVLAM